MQPPDSSQRMPPWVPQDGVARPETELPTAQERMGAGTHLRVPEHAAKRRLELGLQTVLGGEPGGFFIPYRQAGQAEPRSYPALRPLFSAAEPAFRQMIGLIENYATELGRIASGHDDLVGERPARFGQDWFPRLDAATAYATVRHRRPKRIVEIGSGHSSRFMAQAIADGALDTAFTCIDPQPRAPLSGLPLRHEARLFGAADAEAAATLEPGDILFVDSSHIAMPGTDVDRLLLDVLPRLRPGVLVHFHDIFLPDAYPDNWAWRGYNEQIAVGALLQGGAYALVFASHYVAAHTDLLAGTAVSALPIGPDAHEASFWLRKTGA